uniref:FBD domain-containing protein n=1 Tax=Chenopodium quinoa TaxID=63459 RepID=A0A803L7F9_CHEQI
MLPLPFTHVRNLRVTNIDSCKDLSYAVGILRCCPNVEKLQISVKISENTADSAEDKWSCNLSSKFLQLRSIDVRLNSGSAEELKLVEFLLACSPVLQTFNLEIVKELDVDVKMKMSKKLMQFHMAFSDITVFLIFMKGKCDYNDENF